MSPPSTDACPGRAEFTELMAGLLSGGPVDPAEGEPAAADPRPHRPTGNVDQGMRGTHPVDPREAWVAYIDRLLR